MSHVSGLDDDDDDDDDGHPCSSSIVKVVLISVVSVCGQVSKQDIRCHDHENVSMAPGNREQVHLQCPFEGAL